MAKPARRGIHSARGAGSAMLGRIGVGTAYWVCIVSCALAAQAAPHKPILWRHLGGWAGWTAVTAAATVADLSLSQDCTRRFAACREANPLLRDRVNSDGVESLADISLALWSRHLRLHRKRWWRLPLQAVIAGHLTGAALAWGTQRRLQLDHAPPPHR